MDFVKENPTFAASESQLSSAVFPQLVKDHQAGIWQYLRVLGCPVHDADDLTQETFLLVFRRPFQYQGRPRAASYLRRVAYHRFIAYLRCRRPHVELRDGDLVDDSWRRGCANGPHAELFAALAESYIGLPERSRYSLELRYRHGCSRQEIAAALTLSEHGAKNLMQRAKQRLRRSIERRVAASQF